MVGVGWGDHGMPGWDWKKGWHGPVHAVHILNGQVKSSQVKKFFIPSKVKCGCHI